MGKTKNNESKELALAIAKVLKKIVPELNEVTKGAEYTATIADDGEGFRLEVQILNLPIEEEEITAEDIQVAEDEEALDNILKMQLKAALTKTNGNIKKAAALCGMSVKGFKRHMFRLNVLKD